MTQAASIDRNGHVRLAIGEGILQRNLLNSKPVLLRTGMEIRWVAIGHSCWVVILYMITIWN